MTETLTDSTAVALYAGNNGSTLTAGEYTLLINLAEGNVCAQTRRDWVTNYASLGLQVKNALKDVVTALAAMMVINYDQSVFTSGSEARAMLNLLDDKVKVGMAYLKDFDSNELKTP